MYDENQRRKSSSGDADAAKMSGQTSNDPAAADAKWSFNFRRLFGLCILTFLITIFALIYDELSIAIKKVTNDGTGNWCKVEGVCGWRVGNYKYSESDSDYTPSACPPVSNQYNYEIDYGTYCDENSETYSDQCNAVNAGNVWLAFGIISLISLLLLNIIFLKACLKKNKQDDLMVNEKIQKNIRIILIILFGITFICQFIAAFIWLFMSLCDEANPYYYDLIEKDTENSFGVSTGCMLLCFVANLVGFGAVSFCWSDYTELSKNPKAQQDL